MSGKDRTWRSRPRARRVKALEGEKDLPHQKKAASSRDMGRDKGSVAGLKPMTRTTTLMG